MNVEKIDQIARAVLYEGYMLYPYRPSSVKNRQRWNFGVLYPQAWVEGEDSEASAMRTECLISGSSDTTLEVRVRFLHLRTRRERQSLQTLSTFTADGWQEAVEREATLPGLTLDLLLRGPVRHTFAFGSETEIDNEPDPSGRVATLIVRQQVTVEGAVEVSAERLGPDTFKARVLTRNTTPCRVPEPSRDAALMQSLVSSHTILGIEGGEFISLLEPPADLREFAAQCQNIGCWPVLVGGREQRDTMLASPIILYDYPQIAPESAGDLFDGTEIDEILSLRIMTLTDEEKQEIRNSDEQARRILERTETMPAEQFMKLHGALRGLRPLKENET